MESGQSSSSSDSNSSSLYILQEKLDRLAQFIRSDLDGSWVDGGQEFLDFLTSEEKHPDIPADSKIQDFLSEYAEFDSGSATGSRARRVRGARSRGSGRGVTKKKTRGGPPMWWRWRNIPHKPEDPPYDSLAKTMNDILHHFGVINRKVEYTYKAEMPDSCERFNTEPTTTPDLSLMGYGPSFAFQQDFPTPPSYTHVAVPIAVTGSDRAPEDDRIQLAVYARSCFVHQPNRRFVYSLLMTERTVQVFQFDRAGVLYSRPINIHQEAETFVKIILALSTADEGNLGFDTRIQWEGHCRYFRPATDGAGTYMVHSPLNWSKRIGGKATTLWHTQNENGEDLIFKFAWRTPERGLEWEFLEKIAEDPIPGVGEIICRSQLSEMETISSLRGGIGFVDKGEEDANNRQYYYILQPYYGPSLRYAPTTLAFLEAFRDIIQAQFELAKRGIVHRDVSPDNMLLNNRPDVREGRRGILIDFDTAAFVDSDGKGPAANAKIGARVFQSVKVLESLGFHDHLDDLESSFYSLCQIAFTSESPGVPLEVSPEIISDWNTARPSSAMASKLCFLDNRVFAQHPQGLGPVVGKLIDAMKSFFMRVALPRRMRIRPQMRTKKEIERDKRAKAFGEETDAKLGRCQTPTTESSPPPEMPPAEEMEMHFKEFLGLVDGAIDEEKSSLLKAGQQSAPVAHNTSEDVKDSVPTGNPASGRTLPEESAQDGDQKLALEVTARKRSIGLGASSDAPADAIDRQVKKAKNEISS